MTSRSVRISPKVYSGSLSMKSESHVEDMLSKSSISRTASYMENPDNKYPEGKEKVLNVL